MGSVLVKGDDLSVVPIFLVSPTDFDIMNYGCVGLGVKDDKPLMLVIECEVGQDDGQRGLAWPMVNAGKGILR